MKPLSWEERRDVELPAYRAWIAARGGEQAACPLGCVAYLGRAG